MSLWLVQRRPEEQPIEVGFEQLHSLFPTLDISYQEGFVDEPTQELLLNGLSIAEGFITSVDTRKKYAYTDLQVHPNWTKGHPWSTVESSLAPAFQALRQSVATILGTEPNYALVNVYRDGKDEILWHVDDQEGVVPGSCIASISLGDERTFQYRPYVPGNRGRTEAWPVLSTILKRGCLLIMGPQTNEFWTHRVPQQLERDQVRVNITFRFLQASTDTEPPAEGPGTANYARLESKHKSFEHGQHPVFDNPNYQQFLLEHDGKK
jgi:alkylated DNA repair dioxygenase AlkB